MLRHLRTHNRTIMAVGGTLLLVSWALGGALQNLSQRAASAGASWATYGPKGTKVTLQELNDVQAELEVIDILGDSILTSLGVTKEPGHWFLISHEAMDAGLVGGAADGRQRAEEIAAMAAANAQGKETLDADGLIQRLMMRSGRDSRFVERTLAKVNGVHRLVMLYQSMPRFSDTRLKTAAAAKLDAVACDVVALDARTLATPEIPEPSTEELQAQLAKYGEKKPGEGESGFGYRLPDRVQVEWLEIPLAAVRSAVEASAALDSLTLKKKFAENPAKFGADALSGDPLTAFPAYEASVRLRVVDELVTERMNQITKFATDQVALSVRGLPRDGAYIKLPDDWATRRTSFQTLSSQITDEFKIAQPVFMSTGGAWIPTADVKTLTGIGTASSNKFGPTPIQFAQLVERTKELGRGIDTTPVQKDVVGPTLIGTNGSVFLFRIIDVDASRAPKTIEEAGPSLAIDVKAEDRFAALKAAQAEILNSAKTEGVRAIADRYGAKVEFASRVAESNAQMLAFGFRMPATLAGIADAAAVQEVIRLAAALPSDKPVTEVPEADRTFVFPVDSKLTLAVVRVTDRYPLTIEDFQTVVGNPRAKDALLDDEYMKSVVEELSFDALKKRNQFTMTREKADAGKDAEQEATGGAPDGSTPKA